MERETSDDVEIREIVVDGKQSPLRLDKFLVDRLERVTRNKIQQGIIAGAVLVNQNEVKPNYKVRPADRITIVTPSNSDDDDQIKPQDIPLDIIFEDEHLLVVNKASGMVVHPGISNPDGTLVNALAHYLGRKDGPVLDGNPENRPGLVHRIDKYTSGLLVVAKTDFVLSALARQFFDHTIHRKYLALVWGTPEPTEGTIHANIGRHPKDRIKQYVFEEGGAGREAITHYQVEEDLYYVSLVSCQLETGRTHQIRVHMAHLGHPLFNDEPYGGQKILKGTVYTKYKQFVQNSFDLITGQALHAAELGFSHPVTKENMMFRQEPTAGFLKVLERWRNYMENRTKH